MGECVDREREKESVYKSASVQTKRDRRERAKERNVKGERDDACGAQRIGLIDGICLMYETFIIHVLASVQRVAYLVWVSLSSLSTAYWQQPASLQHDASCSQYAV